MKISVLSVVAALGIGSTSFAALTYTEPASHGAGLVGSNTYLSTFVQKYDPADHGGAPLEAIVLTLNVQGLASYTITDNPSQGIGFTGFDFQYTNSFVNTLYLGNGPGGTVLIQSSNVLTDQKRTLAANDSYSTPNYPSVKTSGLSETTEKTVTLTGADLTPALRNAFTRDPGDPNNLTTDLNLYVGDSPTFTRSNTEQFSSSADSYFIHETTVVYGFNTPEPCALAGLAFGGALLGMRRRT